MDAATPTLIDIANSAKLFKALANTKRLQILHVLASGEQTVSSVAERLNMHIATTSGHLIRLRENGFLRAKQQENNVVYSIKDPRIAAIIKTV